MTKQTMDKSRVTPLSNDKSLLELRVQFFRNSENKTMKYITSSYEDFISAFEKSIQENKAFKIFGLENFKQKDVIIGCNHFIDELIMTHGLDNIQQLGGYNYYRRLDPAIKNATLDTLEHGKVLILEYPFPKFGGAHPDFKDIIKKCNELEIDVYLDCAWLPVSWDTELYLDAPCIKGMAMSLSKCFGLHWSRIGVRWLKEERIDSISLQNEHNMISFPNVMIGRYYLDRLPIDHLVNKYKEKYLDLCKELNHKAGNVILISHAHDNSEIYGTANHLLQNEKN
tara:strand:- start:193 stop:1041 length:849 start_codon:yes stop_codon:yes gene_type:complete